MLVGDMTNMNVEGDSLRSRVRVVETKLVHPTSRCLKLKLVS